MYEFVYAKLVKGLFDVFDGKIRLYFLMSLIEIGDTVVNDKDEQFFVKSLSRSEMFRLKLFLIDES